MKAIEFENVGKLYRLGTVGTGTLSHDLNRWWATHVRHKEDPYLKVGETNNRATRGQSDYVWALKDISFSVEQGDVVGIIGKNGAGKSTLLKLLSQITSPTTGVIRAWGRIGSLLEVGTGFHPEMTGRENIYMNGAIMGMTRQEISRKLDEIVDFAGVERYIDTPVKRYSSGMTVRLGFAVAAFMEPEILVVDEVLAVGDFEFQTMAVNKMKEISQEEGRTILFVSHNMDNLRVLCKSGILLENGMVKETGRINTIVENYLSVVTAQDTSNHIRITKEMHNSRWSTYEILFKDIQFKKSIPLYASDEDIVMRITLVSSIDCEKCRICSTISDTFGKPICKDAPTDFFAIKKGEKKVVEYVIKNPGLVKGKYFLSFSVGVGNVFTGERNYSVLSKVASFEIDKVKLGLDMVYMQWSKNNFGEILLHTSIKELPDAI